MDHELSCRQPHDDMQRAAFTAGTTTIEGGPLLIGEKVAMVRSHRLEVLAAKGERQSAIAVGQQTEVTDLDEAGRQHVQQERRMNSTASRLMTLMRFLSLESRQRNRTCPSRRLSSLPLAMATRWV